MDQKQFHNNGNGDSASDLETPYDSVTKDTVQQRAKIDHYGNQFHLSNVVPHFNNNDTGSSIFSETYISENEFSNSSDIMEDTPRKKPLISLNESLYMNVDAVNDVNLPGIFTSPNQTAETDAEILKTDPDRSKNETIENETCFSANKRLENTLLSPNNNSNNISAVNTSRNNAQSNGSDDSSSSSQVDNPNGVTLSESSPQCLDKFESKSSWQFCPNYGMPGTVLDSSEETPSPNSDMSPDISCLQNGCNSFSEPDVASDVSNEVNACHGNLEKESREKEETKLFIHEAPYSSDIISDSSHPEMSLRKHLLATNSAKDQREEVVGKKYITDLQLLNGNCDMEKNILPEESTNFSNNTGHSNKDKTAKCPKPIYVNICPETPKVKPPPTNGLAETTNQHHSAKNSDVKVVPFTAETIEMQNSTDDVVSLCKYACGAISLKKETPGKIEVCIKGSKHSRVKKAGVPNVAGLCLPLGENSGVDPSDIKHRDPGLNLLASRVKKAGVPNVAELCLSFGENSGVEPSDIKHGDQGLNLLAFPKNTSLSCCEIHPLSFANHSSISHSSENGSLDLDSGSAMSDMCPTSALEARSSRRAHGAGLDSRPKDLCFNNQSSNVKARTKFLQPSGSRDLPKCSPQLPLLTENSSSERFINLKDCSDSTQLHLENCDRESLRQGDLNTGVMSAQLHSGSTGRFNCWQGASDHIVRRRDPKHRRPVSFHGSEDPNKFYAEENLYENLSPKNLSQLGALGHRCTSRQTQTDFNRPCGLRQSNSFTAMPMHRACHSKSSADNPPEGFKIGRKVNLGVSSLRSAFPVVHLRRQQKQHMPTSQTSDNFAGVISSLESSQSTPNFVGLCKLSCHPSCQPQLRPHSCKETSWRYTRPVSDSGLFLRNDLFRRSRGNAPNSENSRVPEFLRQISEHAQRAAMSESAKKDRTYPLVNRNNFERRLSDPSNCLPQPPKRSASLGGSLVLAKCLSEPSFKNNPIPSVKNSSKVNDPSQPSGIINAAAQERVYQNVQNSPQTSSPKVPPKPQVLNAASATEPIYENLQACNPGPVTSQSRLSSISDSDTDSSDCVMNERRESYHSSDSSDDDTETDIGSNGNLDSGDNYGDSSDDTSDTVSMDDLLTRLGVVTTQDGDADDEDGFQDSTDDEEEDELLLPISAPTRMCDRPPSPYPGLGDSTDEDRPIFLSGVFHSVNFSSCDIISSNGPARPVRSQTEPDFLDFEILNPEDYGIQHPPSYTDLFPIGTPAQPDMPPSYDDAVRPFSVHQDHFDYAGFQSPPTSNNRFSLPAPDWALESEEYSANPPPAYDEAVLTASGRSNDELSNQSQESPARRSRGRRMFNGLRRFARKIFR